MWLQEGFNTTQWSGTYLGGFGPPGHQRDAEKEKCERERKRERKRKKKKEKGGNAGKGRKSERNRRQENKQALENCNFVIDILLCEVWK